MSTFSWVYKPYTFWDPPLQKKEYTSTIFECQIFLSAKNPHENNKNQAKKLKVYRFFFDFHKPPPPKMYGLYTCDNVDIYGWPLTITNQKVIFF